MLLLLFMVMSRCLNTTVDSLDGRCLCSATTSSLFALSVMVLGLKLRFKTDVRRHNSMLLWPSI